MLFFKKKRLRPPERRNKLLGLPIHIQIQLISLNIGYYIILVLNRVLYRNYIEVPSGIAIFPSEI